MEADVSAARHRTNKVDRASVQSSQRQSRGDAGKGQAEGKAKCERDYCGHELHGGRRRKFQGSSSKVKNPRAVLECENCGEFDFFRDTGACACFDWKFGQCQCEAQRAVGGVEMSKDEELLLKWNEKYEAHNKKAWNSGSSSSSINIREGPTNQRHLFYRATTASFKFLGCKREGCVWNKRLAVKERFKTLKKRACYGERVKEDQDGLEYCTQVCPMSRESRSLIITE